jgi:riboflavin biosynthesis pyrimidine reductase
MEPIRTLLDRQEPASPPVLPEDLRVLYGGDLHIAGAGNSRPYVVGNFVSTLDGVVSYGIPGKSGGGEISGSNEGDRFIMGLLRASVDAVIVGSATLHAAGRSHLWTAQHIYPPASDSYARFRRETLGMPRYPLTVVASASGKIDLDRAAFRTPDVRVVIVTTAEGEERLAAAGARAFPSTELRTVQAPDSHLAPAAILDLLGREFGVRRLLHEGGPALFGSFVAQDLVDEFFLTVAPQLAGRNPESPRPGMIGGVAFTPDRAPWLNLISVKQGGDHLYLRYGNRRLTRPRAG